MVLLYSLLVIALLYGLGRLIYPHTGWRNFILIKVLAQLCWLIFTSFFLIIALVVGFLAVALLVESIMPTASDAPLNKLATGQMMLIILAFILAAAILHVTLRRRILKRFYQLRLSDREAELIEYYIQWITIYVVVYQFAFDGFSNLASHIPELHASPHAFSVILSPQNINLILQPLLITSWITVVVERLARQTAAQRSKIAPKASSQ